MDIQRLHVGKTLSEVAVHNGTVYLAGQIAENTMQDISGQTREVLLATSTGFWRKPTATRAGF